MCQHLHTVHLNSQNEIYDQYDRFVLDHPDHFSVVNGQTEQFLAFEIIARTVFQIRHPSSKPDYFYENMIFFRYPTKRDVRNIDQLFDMVKRGESWIDSEETIPVDKDLRSPGCEDSETALSVFLDMDREESYKNRIYNIFRVEQVALESFKDKIDSLLMTFPIKNRGGIIHQIFLSHGSPISKVLCYANEEGVPYTSPTIQQLFNTHLPEGFEAEHDTTQQVRLFPSGISESKGFIPSNAFVVRYLMCTAQELQEFTAKVQRTVAEIFQEHVSKLNEFSLLLAELDSPQSASEKNKRLGKIANYYLNHFNPILALKYIEQITDLERKNYYKIVAVLNLLAGSDWKIAEKIILKDKNNLGEYEKIFAMLALNYLEKNLQVEILELLKIFPDSPQKNYILLNCALKFPDKEQYFYSKLSMDFSSSEDELMAQNIFVFSFQTFDNNG